LKIQFKDLTKTIDFYITNLGQDQVVLGFPFLQEFNPEINWDTKEIFPTKKILITLQPLWEHRWRIWRQDGLTLQKVSFAQQWAAAADKLKAHLQETGLPLKYR
jgi:hypothetical protein